MTLDQAKLRAYLDQELPEAELQWVETELANSPEAQQALARLRQDVAQTDRWLAPLAPTSATLSPALPALNRLQAHLAGQSTSSAGIAERIRTMFTSDFIKRHQTAVTAFLLIALVAAAFSFAPVRVLAGNLLKIFRVQEVKVVPVDLDRLEGNEELAALLEQLSPETKVVVDGGEPQEVASLAEAAALVDFPVAEITSPPAGAGERTKIMVQNKSVAQLYVDKDLAESIFEAAGIEISLPDSLKDTPVVVTKPTMLEQRWGPAEKPTLSFTQMRSPEIEYPDDLNLDEVGVAALQLLGMSEAEAKAFGATIDWSNTLLLPVPKDKGIEVSEVSVNGAKGFVFQAADDQETAVMWQRDRLTYLLSGQYSGERLLEAARSAK